MINGVKTRQLKLFPDERGRLMEILRNDDDIFLKFGQVYMTTAYPGVVKAWHFHKKQSDFFAVVHGMMKIVLYDSREKSSTKGEINEFFMGIHNPSILVIPPLVYHGFKCISEHEAIVINCPTAPFNRKNPDEFRLPADTPEITYDWERKNG